MLTPLSTQVRLTIGTKREFDMKIELNYGRRVSVIPASAFDKLESATKIDIKILFALSGAVSGIDPDNATVDEIAEKLGIMSKQVEASIDFWQSAGVISVVGLEATEEAKATKPEKKKEDKKEGRTIVRRSDELPSYTTEEISAILEKRKETSYLLDECQQEFGKIFSTRDLNVIVGMLDYLGVDIGYVVALLKYCNKIGKRSTSYAEKLAFNFVEEGIDTTEALKIKLSELEALHDNESTVRKLFGMKGRALTAKEKKCIGLWFGKFGYDKEIVSRAYEITVEAINEPSVSYAHAILERWYGDGIKTLEDVQSSIEARRAEKAKETDGMSSFDTDDFFEAALKRSYGDNKTK